MEWPALTRRSSKAPDNLLFGKPFALYRLVLPSRARLQNNPDQSAGATSDLPPAEARVARSLASGKTVEDIATDGGISANTIRTHVRRVLEKTGCNRQATRCSRQVRDAVDAADLARRHFK